MGEANRASVSARDPRLGQVGEPSASPTAVRAPARTLQPAPLPKQVEGGTAAPPTVRGAPPSLVEGIEARAAGQGGPARGLDADRWNGVVSQLGLTGLVRELANNTALETADDSSVSLVLDEACAQLLSKEREAALKQALEAYAGRGLRLSIRVGAPPRETPARERQRTTNERQLAAEQAIDTDPTVQALKEKFNARVSPGSIRPKV
jgi:DNA polymerase-3 subunit gamma/tau